MRPYDDHTRAERHHVVTATYGTNGQGADPPRKSEESGYWELITSHHMCPAVMGLSQNTNIDGPTEKWKRFILRI